MYRYKLLAKQDGPKRKSFQGRSITQNEWIYSKEPIPEFDKFPSEIRKEEAESKDVFLEADLKEQQEVIMKARERVSHRVPVDPEPVVDPNTLTHAELITYMLREGFIEPELAGKSRESLLMLLSLNPTPAE